MNILTTEGLSKSYSETSLFTDLSISLSEGQKIALIAANGSGKTTLLRIIAGKEKADSGTVSMRKDTTVGYLEQDPLFPPASLVMDCIFQYDHPVMHTIGEYERLIDMGEHADPKELQRVMDRLDALNGWDYESRAAEVLGKLGIHDLDKPVGQLSGGQKKRVALARLLIEQPDLLFLDEPTNHLDLDMIEWLEKYLARLNKTLLLVSHDRYFLDSVCDTIVELENGKAYTYNGNYAYYLEKKEQREQIGKAEIDKARNLYRRELEWMRRQPKARSTKQKARENSFYDTEAKANSQRKEDKMQMTMQMSRMGSKILELENVCKGYDDKQLIKDFSYTFKRGEKIGIVGKNGSGKSTLLNMIMGLAKPDKGRIRSGETMVFGYYSQDGINLQEEKRVIDVVKDIAEYVETGSGNWISVSQFLLHFNFEGSKQYSFVSKLSGGEKKRLYLLTILLRNPNFLILDEPTNDLDIVTLNVLEDFLLGYQGCLLMVTHDRYFMDRLVDHVFVLDGKGKIKDIHGNYTDYREMFADQVKEESTNAKTSKPVRAEEAKTKSNKLSYKEQRALEVLEKEMQFLEAKKDALMLKMNAGDATHEQLAQWSAQYQQTEKEIEEKTAKWFQMQEKS